MRANGRKSRVTPYDRHHLLYDNGAQQTALSLIRLLVSLAARVG